MADEIHELSAAYALDALDADERERFEAHLAGCENCRVELEGLWAVADSLARGAGGPPPPPALRERILAEASRERSNVIPFRRRFALPAYASAAAVAAVAAIGLGIWSTTLADDLDTARSELAILGHPQARTVSSPDGEASLVLTPSGEAALIVRSLPPAPDGKDYEIWVLEDGEARRAGLFDRPGVALLSRRVSSGQRVAVTLEADGGVDEPTSTPLFSASSA